MKKNNYLEIIYNNILKNKKIYVVLLILLFIGIVLGVFFVNNCSETERNEISEYINNFIATLKENNSIDKKELIKVSLQKNILIGIVLWFIGSTVIGLPLIYFFVVYKGLCLGYTISGTLIAMGTGKGLVFCLSTILIQNIIFIPALFLIGASSTKLCYAIIKNRNKENIKIELIKHSLISIIIIICFMLSSLTEVYISTNLLEFVTKYI